MNVVVSREAELDVINAIASCDSISRQDTKWGVDGGLFSLTRRREAAKEGEGRLPCHVSQATSRI